MTRTASDPVFERLVELTCFLIGMSRGLEGHIETAILPHLDPSRHSAFYDLLAHLKDHEITDAGLIERLHSAVAVVRQAIADGTDEVSVPIPRERLLGGSESYDIKRTLSPEAEALKAALPSLERVQQAARAVSDQAEAIRLSAKLIDNT